MSPEKIENGRVRVIHLASGDLWAGAEVQTLNLVRALHERDDVDVEVILLNEGELASRLRAEKIDVTTFPERTQSATQIIRGVRQRIASSRRCIVHTHRTKENIIGALAAASCAGAASLRTVHGRAETRPSKSLRSVVLSLLDRGAGALQSNIVAVSDELGTHLRKFYRDSKVVCIPNGVDVVRIQESASRPSLLAPSERQTIGIVGRIVAVKRLDLFLATACELRSRDPGKYRFIVLGDGPLRDSMQAMSRDRGLDSCVEFLGFQSDALPTLRSLDCLMMCSDHEGLPMVALEALTLGVPVIAHAVGGLPEVLAGQSLHRLVTQHSANAYAEAVRGLSADLLELRGKRQSLLPARYRIASSAASYHSLYQRLWNGLTA